MITQLFDYAVTCDVKGPNCNVTCIVERAEDERQVKRVLVTKGWTLSLINEICPACWKDEHGEEQTDAGPAEPRP